MPFLAGKRRRLAEAGWRASPAGPSPSALPDAPAQPSPVTLESLHRSLEDLRISVLRNCESGGPLPGPSPPPNLTGEQLHKCPFPQPPLPLSSPKPPRLTLPRWLPFRSGSRAQAGGGPGEEDQHTGALAGGDGGALAAAPPAAVAAGRAPFRPSFPCTDAPLPGRLLLRFTFLFLNVSDTAGNPHGAPWDGLPETVCLSSASPHRGSPGAGRLRCPVLGDGTASGG